MTRRVARRGARREVRREVAPTSRRAPSRRREHVRAGANLKSQNGLKNGAIFLNVLGRIQNVPEGAI